jgi:hypothetical protein
MQHYFKQIAPEMDWQQAKEQLWRSVDVFGEEKSAQKEQAIARQILTEGKNV